MAVGIEEVIASRRATERSRLLQTKTGELLRSYGGLIGRLRRSAWQALRGGAPLLENLHESVIQIANGFNTGRTLLGRRSPILPRGMPSGDIESTGQDHTQSYFARSRTGA